jgi:HEAT repeat protein
VGTGNGEEGNHDAVSVLSQAQNDRDSGVRAAAALGLSVLRADPDITGPALLRALRSDDPSDRAAAVTALAYQLPSQWARWHGVHGAIVAALGDPEARVGARALTSFLVVAERDPSVFTAALKSTDSRIRRMATEALVKNAVSAGKAYPVLVYSINDQDAEVRKSAANALLGALIDQKASVPPALVKAVADPNAEVHGLALRGLAKYGPRARLALPAVLRLQADVDVNVRRAAVEAEASIESAVHGEAAIIELFAEMLNSTEPEKRSQAARSLAIIGPAAARTLPALSRLIVDDPDPHVRESAASAKDAITQSW